MTRYVMAVRSNPVAGREKEFDDWYDRELLPDMVRTPTIVAGQRYRLAPVELPAAAGLPRAQHLYLALYDIETDSIERTVRTLWSDDNVRRIRPSDTLDYSNVDCQFYAPVGPRLERPR